MDAVIVNPPADQLAERQRLGLDAIDEVWDGEYHMVPPPHDEHGRVGVELLAALIETVRDAGLLLRYEHGLIPPEEPGWNDFRVPDLVVFPPSARTDRGAIGASLVIEVRSPGDESFAKLPFYERLGVGEVLIIDRDTKDLRRWVHDGTVLDEPAAAEEGRHRLVCLPVELWTDEQALIVRTPHGVTRI